MAIKKSELYSALWASCDKLRGGMDASQYKNYVLSLLFIKYVSDKYAGERYAPVEIPKGASFDDMVGLKGKPDIGDRINKDIIAPLVKANAQLSLGDFPNFNDPAKLGNGKEMVERLTDLIAIFEQPALDFSRNRAEDDDLLGDAYEYLMRNFATESGKSKGQFYTPAEVSRTIALLLEIRKARTTAQTTFYDPTCGSGSLLLKVGAEARAKPSLYGQEKDESTSGLARMNMYLHNQPGAVIEQGNTLAGPRFVERGQLKVFDVVVANPPFSDKSWSDGLDPENDDYGRFAEFGVPPAKQGDYAYLLHIVKSMKPGTGKGACILPHGVLFRGNAEADIRRNLVRKGYLKGIIGLPPNIFYGTGIPACIVVLDKNDAAARKGVFMIDASKGFLKDGAKNRLRARDIHKIVDTFTRAAEIPKYSRMVSFAEIEKNDYNLNLPRYVDSTEPEDLQDIDGHLNGGIPQRDVDALSDYWAVCPKLRAALFKPLRKEYLALVPEKAGIKAAIFGHVEFEAFVRGMADHFAAWCKKAAKRLRELQPGFHPRDLIGEISEGLLDHYEGRPLVDPYAVYQHLMDYWAETLQDDAYLISADGWQAETARIVETDKKGREKDKGWACDLVPKPLVVARFFAKEQAELDRLTAELEATAAKLTELEEEKSGEDGAFADCEKINKAEVAKRLKEIKGDKDAKDEIAVLKGWLDVAEKEADLKKQVRDADADLDAKALAKYPKLTVDNIKALVVDDKWLAVLEARVHGEMDRISQALTARVKQLAERYETPMPQLAKQADELEAKVNRHLEKMGFAWK